jgi:ATP/maltotriose-dependent transcriptional regulator MalT
MKGDTNVARAADAEARSGNHRWESGLLGDDSEVEAEVEAHFRKLFETLSGIISIASPDASDPWSRTRGVDDQAMGTCELARWRLALVEGLGADEAPPLHALCHALSDLNSYITALLSSRHADTRSRQTLRRVERRSNRHLSARERAVLALIAKGQSNKRVAQTLKITPETVKSHLKRVFVKLGSKTRAEAVARATELGFLANVALLPAWSYGSAGSIRGANAPTSSRTLEVRMAPG